MTDRMDELLSGIASEANANVNFDALYSSLLNESKKRAASRRKTLRMAWAAAFVALVGAGGIALSSGFGNKDAQAPMLAMAADTTMAADMVEEACVEEAAPAEEPAAAEEQGEVAAAGATQESAASNNSQLDRDGGLYSSFSREDMFEIGLPCEGWQQKLNTALPNLEIQLEDVENGLESGFAYISKTGNYAIWNTGSGMYSVMGETGAREAMLDELKKMCN